MKESMTDDSNCHHAARRWPTAVCGDDSQNLFTFVDLTIKNMAEIPLWDFSSFLPLTVSWNASMATVYRQLSLGGIIKC